jgi:bifunctional phosphoglucose/phosphomannose isomerase
MASLDNLLTLRRYDRSDILELISSLPSNCSKAREIGLAFKLPHSYKRAYSNIICTGLGGSAIGADIVRSYIANQSKTPLFVNRGYEMPAFTGKSSLVIACSYSGDTEETLSSYKEARRKGSKIVVITSGGCLSRMAHTDGYPVLMIPGGLPPRCALGYSATAILMLLSQAGIIKDQSGNIREAVAVMERLRDTVIAPAIPTVRNTAKRIAHKLYCKYPVIYGAQDRMDAVVTRWRGQLAENSKTLASSHLFPEMNHNEIVGWDNPAELLKKFAVIIVRDKGDHPRVAKRIDITEKLISDRCSSITEVRSYGKGLLARIFSLVYIGDFVSFYLAILNGCDPTPVERITYLKKQLGRKG